MGKGVIHAIYQMHKESGANPGLQTEIKLRICSLVGEKGGIRDQDIPRLTAAVRWLMAMLIDSVRSGKAVPIVIPLGHENYIGRRFGYRLIERVLKAFKAQTCLSLKVVPPSRYGELASEALATRWFTGAHKNELIPWVRDDGSPSDSELWMTDKDQFSKIRSVESLPIDSSTQGWVANLRVINDFNQTVPLFLFEDDQTIRNLLCDRFLTFHETRYNRIFCRGRRDCGGRFYSTWWQSIPSEYRSSISIDGQQVVEFDYSGMAIRLLYARLGLQPPSDPYDLGLSTANLAETRKILKLFVLAITNDKLGKFRLKRREYDMLGVNHEALVNLLARKHPKISRFFFSDVGVELQYLDSKIAEQVMLKGIQHGFVILSIHDGFIAQARHRATLEQIMKDVYLAEVGWPADIRQEEPKRCPQISLPASQSMYATYFHETYLASEIASGRRKPAAGGLGDYSP